MASFVLGALGMNGTGVQVFPRTGFRGLAQKHLRPQTQSGTAGNLGVGESPPFEQRLLRLKPCKISFEAHSPTQSSSVNEFSLFPPLPPSKESQGWGRGR